MIDITFCTISTTAGVYVPREADAERDCERLQALGIIGRYSYGPKTHGYHLNQFGYTLWHRWFGHPSGIVDAHGNSDVVRTPPPRVDDRRISLRELLEGLPTRARP